VTAPAFFAMDAAWEAGYCCDSNPLV